MPKYEYLVCNEYGDVMFVYYNEDDAFERAFRYEGWSVSKQVIEEKEVEKTESK